MHGTYMKRHDILGLHLSSAPKAEGRRDSAGEELGRDAGKTLNALPSYSTPIKNIGDNSENPSVKALQESESAVPISSYARPATKKEVAAGGMPLGNPNRKGGERNAVSYKQGKF